jgi:hypothetical protein
MKTIYSLAVMLILCCMARAETIWHLEIPIPGSYRCPANGTLYTPVITAARFADANAVVKFMELTYTDDIGTRGRNYDAYALVDTDDTFELYSGSAIAYVGAAQVGRYTGGYPQVMNFFVRYDWDTATFQFSTPGNQSATQQSRQPVLLSPSGLFYTRAMLQCFDGDSGPLATNLKIKVNVACATMPGAVIKSTILQNGAVNVNWSPSPATEALKQKLYRGPSASGP